MSQPYVGEIRMFGGNFAPAGWAFCQGQTMAISENDTLFQLIGTTYGGDGQSTFNLPNLSSRVPLHMGTGAGSTYSIGQAAGTEQETLTVQQIPIHTHTATATNDIGNSAAPGGHILSAGSVVSTQPYGTDAPTSPLSASSIGAAGGSQPHENCQPFLCINFIISLFGVFPSQT